MFWFLLNVLELIRCCHEDCGSMAREEQLIRFLFPLGFPRCRAFGSSSETSSEGASRKTGGIRGKSHFFKKWCYLGMFFFFFTIFCQTCVAFLVWCLFWFHFFAFDGWFGLERFSCPFVFQVSRWHVPLGLRFKKERRKPMYSTKECQMAQTHHNPPYASNLYNFFWWSPRTGMHKSMRLIVWLMSQG